MDFTPDIFVIVVYTDFRKPKHCKCMEGILDSFGPSLKAEM